MKKATKSIRKSKVSKAASKQELQQLIAEINQGTATNNRISRFLELADNLGIY